MTDYAQLVAAICAVIVGTGAATAFVMRQWGKVLTAKGEADARAVIAKAEAEAKATVIGAETDRSKVEQTGRFITAQQHKDEQIESLMGDVRAELRQCAEDRRAQDVKIEALREQVHALERQGQLDKELLDKFSTEIEAKERALAAHVEKSDRTIAAMRVEIADLRRVIQSGERHE